MAHAGYVVGKSFRMIEWDLDKSPQDPDGVMVRVTMSIKLTRASIREAVAKAYKLESPKLVKQFAHSFPYNGKVFYEKLDSRAAILDLPEGAVLVWTQVSAAHTCLSKYACVFRCIQRPLLPFLF